ncbi:hypothetical protein G5B46_06785 [Caulobacter sp. 602-2]|uniref:Uncharacterized protein n=1 Tax=Caulobacter sp. 602-2 TaxID=2710887 RepID=A0A6G4QV35_9CAUL|nr:hypothetical protein [Caulobacter sp. 602-2]NGM49307.1 hypothetical protein [Caulobacter sp. 602-2]
MPPPPTSSKPRIHRQAIEKLSRFACVDVVDGRQVERTLYFTFPGGARNRRCNVTFVDPENVPPFEGDQAWFLMELVVTKPWSYWRAVRQVGQPDA